jgi:hypothetical protein
MRDLIKIMGLYKLLHLGLHNAKECRPNPSRMFDAVLTDLDIARNGTAEFITHDDVIYLSCLKHFSRII